MAKETNKQAEVNVAEVVSRSEAFITKNKKGILGGIGAVILLIVAVMCYNNFISAPRETKAAETLAGAERLFAAGQYELALNGDSLETVGLLAVIEEYSGTKAGNLAKAYAGISLAQLNRYEEAVEYLNAFSADDAMVAPAVLGTLGNCYAQLGQEEKAASTLMKAASKADNNSLSPIYLLQAGQLYEKLGKAGYAIDAYTRIKEDYSNSVQAADVDKYIERAGLK